MSLRKLQRRINREAAARQERIWAMLPKPPRDETGCACGCSHKANDRGPCPKFIKGANDRCAVCDHGPLCHRRKGEPPPKDWNTPLSLPANATRVLPPSAKACPHCKVRLLPCNCKQWVPIKSYDSGYHIGFCVKCGHFDQPCPKAPTQ